MEKDIIKELVPSDEPYSGKILEKTFVSAIKGCKTIRIENLKVEQTIQQSLLDTNESFKEKPETKIHGYFELTVKEMDKKNKLDYIIDEIEKIKKNALSPQVLQNVIEFVVHKNVEPKLINIENRLSSIESCPTIQNEIKSLNEDSSSNEDINKIFN